MDKGIELLGDNILVEELTDDLVVNGVITAYDSDNPYMFCRVVNVSKDVNAITIGNILVIKRYAKEEFLPGYYFISSKDVRCIVDEDFYESLES